MAQPVTDGAHGERSAQLEVAFKVDLKPTNQQTNMYLVLYSSILLEKSNADGDWKKKKRFTDIKKQNLIPDILSKKPSY